MNCNDLNFDAKALRQSQADIACELKMVSAEPLNAASQRVYAVHLEQHRKQLERFVDAARRRTQ